jgi:hypothetical protein
MASVAVSGINLFVHLLFVSTEKNQEMGEADEEERKLRFQPISKNKNAPSWTGWDKRKEGHSHPLREEVI